MARAGTLPSYLYQSENQPGEPVSLERSDLEEQQEKSDKTKRKMGCQITIPPSSDEESADDETACDVGEIPSFKREANFLLVRVSRF